MKFQRLAVVALFGTALLGSPCAWAQGDLPDAIKQSPDRPLDTALIFTNLGNAAAKVKMRAFNQHGEPVGGAEIAVPANGLSYVFASDLKDATTSAGPFLGKVEAVGYGHLTATAVLLGGPVTDLPALVRVRRLPTLSPPEESEAEPAVPVRAVTQITFPLVVAH